MLNTLIIGIDGRQGGRDALAVGGLLAQLTGASALAVHVYPYEPFPLHGAAVDVDALARERAESLLQEELQAVGVDARTVVVPATSPGRGIHVAAEDLEADLVVVGPSHRGAVGRVVAGDTVRAVLQGADVPVLVARPVDEQASASGLTIGVGFDGSHESRAALAWAADLAGAIGASVRVLTVAESPQAFTPAVSYGINWVTLQPQRDEWARKLVDEAVAQAGDRASGQAVSGIGYQELIAFSNDVDLLVLGSRGYGPVRRTLLGSTSDRVVHVGSCSVAVVPRDAE
jgi:nucleotide-binding universal stress UspA family protein